MVAFIPFFGLMVAFIPKIALMATIRWITALRRAAVGDYAADCANASGWRLAIDRPAGRPTDG